ncbi:MAG TPA: ATP-binding cassette domain-containing protein [Verrucomicrobiae bacterium]|nr:ATP-binding cassette domain-containing protein [Verrucomicrobiae bacterium]
MSTGERPEASSRTIIETRGLRRIFSTRRGPVEAVAGVDLSVAAGTIFGFLGPNGAGKTTTLRMLTTLLPPTGGEATVAGCDLRREPARVRQRVGYVSQRGGSDGAVTGRSEVVFQARLYGMSAADARARARELIASFQLDECADRRTQSYSGGQRRRLDLACGLVHRPQLLFLDEPTTGLDPQSRAHLWEEVRRLRAEGTSIFLTTHYLEEADQLCDQLTIIDQGRLVAAGTPSELKRQIAGDVVTLGVGGDPQRAVELLQRQPFVRETTAGADEVRCFVDRGETATPALLRLLDGAGIELRSLSLSRPSLDDVFLRQTGRRLREEAA